MSAPGRREGATDRRLDTEAALEGLAFDARGLVPVVAQSAASGEVLMVAWATREALALSLRTGDAHFWSRSREALWRKGDTSGNALRVVSLHADCDGDTVLARVEATGPACHTGERSCFGDGSAPRAHALDALWDVLDARASERPEGSYTTKLLDDENLRLKKIGEETAELVTALARGDAERTPEEAADLLYHVLVALRGAGVDLETVLGVLESRRR